MKSQEVKTVGWNSGCKGLFILERRLNEGRLSDISGSPDEVLALVHFCRLLMSWKSSSSTMLSAGVKYASSGRRGSVSIVFAAADACLVEAAVVPPAGFLGAMVDGQLGR